MPDTMRLAFPNVLALTSACTSTSNGRDPSIEQCTADPGVLAGRSERNSAEGFGTAIRPSRVISNSRSWLAAREGCGPLCPPLAGHLARTKLARRAEPILHRAHDPMRVMPLALEIQDGVDDVLQHLRSGQAAILGHVADDEDGNILALGGEQDLRRGLTHLADAARRRLHLQREDRLDRIDDEDGGPEANKLLEDPFETGLGEQIQRRTPNPQPLAAQFDLMLRLLARTVEDGARRSRASLRC